MAEPFANPGSMKVEKLREQLGDPFLFCMMQGLIKHLNSLKGQEITPNTWQNFYREARLVILNYGATTAFQIVELAVEDIANETWKGQEFEIPIFEKPKPRKSFRKVNSKITISEVAEKYGLEKRKGGNWICPFHESSGKNSLSLSDEKGLFNCFGCNAKGDIITFVKMLEELKEVKNGEKRS